MLNRVSCQGRITVWSDEPFLSTTDDKTTGSPFNGKNQILDLDRYIERNRGISFIVIRGYRCCNAAGLANPGDPLAQWDEAIKFASVELCTTLNKLRDTIPNGSNLLPEFKWTDEHLGLHYLLYHCVEGLFQLQETVTGVEKKPLLCFLEYIRDFKLPEFRSVAELFGERKVTRQYLLYLFVSNRLRLHSHLFPNTH